MWSLLHKLWYHSIEYGLYRTEEDSAIPFSILDKVRSAETFTIIVIHPIISCSQKRKAQNTTRTIYSKRFLKIWRKCKLYQDLHFFLYVKMQPKRYLRKLKSTTIAFHKYQFKVLCILRVKGTVCKHFAALRKVIVCFDTTINLLIENMRGTSLTINESRLDDGNTNLAQKKSVFWCPDWVFYNYKT